MKRCTISLVMLLCSICLNAQQRSESEAIQIAQEFFGKKGKTPRLSVVSNQKVEAQIRKNVAGGRNAVSAKNQSFYVVNDEANDRFVIVSADERMYTILGYSDNGVFDAEKLPVALFEIFDGYDKQYDLIIDYSESLGQSSPQRVATAAIEPLIKTKWGQETPYNDDCPANKRATDGSLCASGCVATAMAQVMNYHQYPTVGIGSYVYSSQTQNYLQAMDFGNTTFYWDRLLDTYGDDATDEQRAEVAKLMHACGISVSMDYGSSSDGQSGAFPYDIPYALTNYFGYNPNITYKQKDYYSADEWEALILQELEAGRPMIYGGYGSGGHCFVLDGCDENGLYHFNFGWTLPGLSFLDGYGNGYYSLDAIRPQDLFLNLLLGEEFDLGDYTNRQNMICQISPDVIGIHEDVFYASTFSLSAYSAKKIGDKISGSLRATNYSSSTSSTDLNSPKFDGEIGLGLYDSKFNFITSLYSEPFNKKSSDYAYISLTATLSADLFVNGKQYIIAPYAKANTSEEPTRIRSTYGKGWYLAKVSNGEVTLTQNGTPDDTGSDDDIVYKPIPTGTIYASAMGANSSQVQDDNEKPTIWQLTLTKDSEAPAKYWFDNIDPSVTGNNNRVYGIADTEGTQIRIPTGQSLGGKYTITNYSYSGDIIVDVASADSTMHISNAWGTIETDTAGENATQSQVSFYSSTDFSFKPFIIEEEQEIVISKPLITVNNTNMMSITCSTEGVDIRYTLTGNEPTNNSALYTSPIELMENCIIKAVAFKDGKLSETAEYEVASFVVEKPVISANGTTITILCSTPDADIYYTLDGSTPNKNKIKYTEAFECENSAVIKAVAIRNKYKDSEVATYIHNVTPTSSDVNITIANLQAGTLSEQITPENKLQIIGLTISSGSLNGSDIKYIREMILNGKLNTLDIENATIVNGGDVYYSSYTKDYSTENNVIGDYMFYGCKGLFNLSLPASATKINGYAIHECDNLKHITLPAACTTVESFGVYNCKNLETITIAAATSSIHWSNMYLCPNLRYIEVVDENNYFVSEDGILFSKDMKTIFKYPVSRDAISYSIPVGVTKIADYAFTTAKLESINIPEGITEIESSAFADCNNLTEIVIPNSVVHMGMMAFNNCTNLYSVTLSDNLQELETLVFGYCVNLQSINIPKSIKEINGSAFNGCSSLKEFTISDDNTWFTTNDGIIYTKNLKKLVKCPMALYTTAYRIPDGVEEISDYAFNKCKYIEKFYLPESVRTIASSAFEECSMTSIGLPQGVSSIEMMAFEDCDKLESFVIPESVEEIPMLMLAYCDNLSYLYIPANVKTVGLSAFTGCKSLSIIDCRIVNVDLVDFKESYGGNVEAFKNIPDTCTWRIPAGCSERYKAQRWWISTWRIIEDNADGIDDVVIDSMPMTWTEGRLVFTAGDDGIVRICDLKGVLIRNISVKKGEVYQIELPRGVYIINNRKVFFK